jgi:beta-galactosidase/beta-glucuronidase
MNKKYIVIIISIIQLISYSVIAQEPYSKKTAKLMTTWGENLQATDPVLPEYPRPQMVREKWMNLNGIWQFQPATSATEALPAGNLAREILVPFPVESALSGIMETKHKDVWYRRPVTLPAGWNPKTERVLLHFGAVDYACELFVNGKSVGKHEGGYDPFSFDITANLKPSGAQDIALRVHDETMDKGYPRGKQTYKPQGIMYTATTGIWQTVWLEAVPQSYIGSIRMTPDIDKGTLKFSANPAGAAKTGLKLRFKIYDNGKKIADMEKNSDPNGVTLDIPKPLKLWSPDAPFLYDMKVYLVDGKKTVDSISTYFGMRKISKQLVDGYHLMMLNNDVIFQMGPLDQGFWPDGIYTAPTDEALRSDIELTKKLGFNMIRKHIKVEPQRWYYWCDKLGMLVWQDMPSMNSYDAPRGMTRETDAFKRELEAMIRTHWNSPAIVSWVLFNEHQGAHDECALVSLIRSLDDSRIINVGSGGPDSDCGDIRDHHNYPTPACPPKRGEQVLVCGEYGGIGYYEAGHIWKEGNPYETVTSRAMLLEKYAQYADMVITLKISKGLNAAVYTEITDVEGELNGFVTYDRKVLKGKAEDFYAINRRVMNANGTYTEIVPTSEETPQTWKYTTSQPASNWMGVKFDDASWKSGVGGFGTENTPGAIVKTVWNTDEIWLRRTFKLPADALAGEPLMMSIHHDEDCEVYINGVLALKLPGWTGGYLPYKINPEALAALNPGEENTLAVHCKQTQGGQYIDAGFVKITIK